MRWSCHWHMSTMPSSSWRRIWRARSRSSPASSRISETMQQAFFAAGRPLRPSAAHDASFSPKPDAQPLVRRTPRSRPAATRATAAAPGAASDCPPGPRARHPWRTPGSGPSPRTAAACRAPSRAPPSSPRPAARGGAPPPGSCRRRPCARTPPAARCPTISRSKSGASKKGSGSKAARASAR